MDYCKLFVITSILFFGGVYGQLRFQRHLNATATTTHNGLEEGLAEVNGSNLDGELTSDYGEVVLKGSGETVEVELLKNGQLELQVCSNGCTDREVIVCYDAVSGSINKEAKAGCGENQCGIKAGVKYNEHGKKVFYFMTLEKTLTSSSDTFCGEAAMKYPTAAVSGFDVKSCDPVKHDGNIVKLYVKQVYPGCSIKVLNAKIWYPATTPSPTTPLPLSTPASKSNESGSSSSSSNADTTWWIVGGILAGIFVLVILGCIGFCVYRNHQQKKDAAAAAKAEHELRFASLDSLPTLDLPTTVTAVQKEEQEKPKKKVVKKDKTQKTKKKHKKIEVAPEPAKLVASKEAPPSVPASKVLTSKEATTEEPKVKPSKEKATMEVKGVQKAATKEKPMNTKKFVQKEVAAAAVPPPPPRRKTASLRQNTVDKTQEESPSIEQQNALEDVSSSPSIEKKPPKKAPPKKAAKKSSKKKHAPPSTPPPRRRHGSKKASSRQLYSREKERPHGFSSQEWMEIQEQKMRPPYIEYNPTGGRY